MSDALPVALPAADVLAALLTASISGVVVFRPLYAAGDEGGEIIDLAWVHLNPAAQRMLSKPACPPETFLTLYPSAKDSGVFVLHCDSFRSGQLGRLDINYQHDGLDNYYHLAVQRAGDLLVVSFTDTADHDRSAAEVALRQSQVRERAAHAQVETQRQRLLNVFAQAPVLIARLTGPDYLVELVNERFQRVFGDRQLTGLPYREAIPELAEQGFFEFLDAVYRTGETYETTEAPVYLRLVGPEPAALYYFSFIYQATRDETGRIDGVLVVAHEVTEPVRARHLLEEQAGQLAQLNQELEARVFERTQALRHAQAAAEATAQQLLRMSESLPSTSITSDQSGQVLYISPQWYAYTGMMPGEDVTAAWPQFIHPDDLPILTQKFGAALAEGRSWGYEFRLRRFDGQYRWFASQGAPEPLAEAEAAGRSRQWFGSNLDIDDLKRAQQQVEEKDQLLTSIFSSLPASVVTYEGEDLRFGFFNDPFQCRVQGRAVLGRPAGELFPEAEEQGFLPLLREVLRTGEPYQAREVRAQTRDLRTGQPWETYLDLTYLPLRHGQQPPHAVLSFTIDATERVKARRQAEAAQVQALAAAEQAAAQREAFFQVFEQTPALITILRGPDHRFVYYNAAQERVFPGRQLRGMPLAEVLPDAVSQGFVALLNQVYATGEPYVGTEVPAYLDQPDGRPARLHYFTFAYQRFEEDGAPAGISVFGTDVTEQVLARQQREAQQQRQQELFEQVPVAMGVFAGPDYIVEICNPRFETILGRTAAAVLHRPIFEAIPEARDQGFLELLDAVRATGTPHVAYERLVQVLQHGVLTGRYLDFVYHPIFNAQGEVTAVATVGIDVSEQVTARQLLADANAQLTAANRQLTHTNVDLDNFIYSASHDLKQPIANIEGLLDALHEELPADLAAALPVGSILARMANSVERFQRTLNHLTDITRLQKEYTPTAVAVSVAAVLDDVCLDLAPLLAASGGRFTRNLAQCQPVLFAEKFLRSVLFNLLSNALKYRSPHRTLHVAISCHAVPGYQVLEVHDNGLGIPQVQQPRLFGMFQRFHDHVEGTGVGLFMVRRMVENTGGRIEVHSQEGIGTTFFVYFPVADEPVA